MRPVFRDEALQQEFDRAGYVRVPFLSPEETRALKQAYFDTLPESGGSLLGDESDFKTESETTYDLTFIDRNPAYKQKVFDIITAAFREHHGRLLQDYEPIIANYFRKDTGGGTVPLHQNWAFVDERECTSVSIWCPLVDSDERNGTLQVVEGSHKRIGEFRGPMVPWELSKIEDYVISRHLKPLNTRAGDAVILDDSIVHFSDVNQTDELRLTIQLILIPKEHPAIHYHMSPRDNPDEIQLLEVDRDFFMNFHPWNKPEGGKLLRVLPAETRFLGEDDFQRVLDGPRFDEAS